MRTETKKERKFLTNQSLSHRVIGNVKVKTANDRTAGTYGNTARRSAVKANAIPVRKKSSFATKKTAPRTGSVRKAFYGDFSVTGKKKNAEVLGKRREEFSFGMAKNKAAAKKEIVLIGVIGAVIFAVLLVIIPMVMLYGNSYTCENEISVINGRIDSLIKENSDLNNKYINIVSTSNADRIATNFNMVKAEKYAREKIVPEEYLFNENGNR